MKQNLGKSGSCLVSKYIDTDFDYVVNVSENMDAVVTVDGMEQEVKEILPHVDNIKKVSDGINEVKDVSNNMNVVADVHNNMDALQVTSGNINIITEVKNNLPEIQLVADNINAIDTVAGQITNISDEQMFKLLRGEGYNVIGSTAKAVTITDSFQMVVHQTKLYKYLGVVPHEVTLANFNRRDFKEISLDKGVVLPQVFGTDVVDLVNGLVITPVNNQYPKLAAFGAIYEIADNSVSYTVKSFVQSVGGDCVITLSDNTPLIAKKVDAASKTWVQKVAKIIAKGGLTPRSFSDFFGDILNVKSFGVLPIAGYDNYRGLLDVSDEYEKGGIAAIVFPNGIYETSGLFQIRQGRVYIAGQYKNNIGLSSSADSHAGATLRYTTNDGGLLFQLGDSTTTPIDPSYQAYLSGIRFDGAPHLTVKPRLTNFEYVSELTLEDCSGYYGSSGFRFAESGIVYLKNCHTNNVDYPIEFVQGSIGSFFSSMGDVWVIGFHAWETKGAVVRFAGRFMNNYYFDEGCRFERSRTMFEFDATEVGELIVNNLVISHSYFLQDSTLTESDVGWFMNFKCQQNSDKSLRAIGIHIEQSNVNGNTSVGGDAIRYQRGNNTGRNSFIQQMQISSSRFTGTGYNVINTDSGNNTILDLFNDLDTGVTLSAGRERVHTLRNEFGRIVFDGCPIKLPVDPNIEDLEAGQIWMNGAEKLLSFSDGTAIHRVPKRANFVAQSSATTIQQLKTDFNGLVNELKNAGAIKR